MAANRRRITAAGRAARTSLAALSPLIAAPLLAAALLAAPPAAAQSPDSAATAVAGSDASGSGPGAGGSAQADFDTLIDLITSTVERDSWQENGTGQGDIMPFAVNGVYLDAQGSLQIERLLAPPPSLPASAATPRAAGQAVRRTSALRVVALRRLEQEIVRRQEIEAPLDETMLVLAGLQRVAFVAIDPPTGDLLLAGPAGDWRAAPGGTFVAVETGLPLVRLDDLLALWRRERRTRGAAFGCSIVPRPAGLAQVQEFLAASAAQPLEPAHRRRWLDALRARLGPQDVEFYQVDARSRVAAILLAADYHMKLIGMGLVPGVPGVRSYLAAIRVADGGAPPPLSVLRWWFAMPTTPVAADAASGTYALPDRCLQVLSENELLAARGQRVPTGVSEEPNRAFAASFTEHLPELCAAYAVYGELTRLFELAAVTALIEREGLAERVGWDASTLLSDARLRLPRVAVPQTVESVINHRVIGRRHLVAGVSGGAWVEGQRRLELRAARPAVSRAAAPPALRPAATDSWWWDAAAPGEAAPNE
jgi:hypothetical protein